MFGEGIQLKPDLAESVEALVSNLENSRETKTILFADLYGSTAYKLNHSDLDWVPVIGQFYKLATKAIEERGGQVTKFIGDAVMATFDDAGDALRAAITIQETIEEERRRNNRGLPCKIGIATGPAYRYQTSDGKFDYLGTTVDIAARLAEEARGFAILLSSKTYQAADVLRVTSRAGLALNREPEEYFGEKIAHDKMKGIKDVVYYYSLFWQGSKAYVDDKPAEQSVPPAPPGAAKPAGMGGSPTPPGKLEAGVRYRGVVERITPQRYGWISLSLASGQAESIFFHENQTLERQLPSPGEVVHFLVRERHDGKRQACSIVRQGSELKGKITRYTPPGDMFGFLAAKDEDLQDVMFYFVTYDISGDIHTGDEVSFKVSENPRGLKAVQIKPLHQGKDQEQPGEENQAS